MPGPDDFECQRGISEKNVATITFFANLEEGVRYMLTLNVINPPIKMRLKNWMMRSMDSSAIVGANKLDESSFPGYTVSTQDVERI